MLSLVPLGDSVFAVFDVHDRLVLTLEPKDGPGQTIVLTPGVVRALVEYIAQGPRHA